MNNNVLTKWVNVLEGAFVHAVLILTVAGGVVWSIMRIV